MLSVFLGSLLLGFLFNAIPGALFTESLRRGLRGGFSPAFPVQIGSLVGDALWALLGLFGVSTLLRVDWLSETISIAGALFLLYLGWQGIRDALQLAAEAKTQDIGTVLDDSSFSDSPTTSALSAGILMSVTNPHNLAFWAALGAVIPSLGVATPTGAHYLLFFTGFMVSSVLWCFICAGLIAWMRHRLPTGLQASLAFVCGATLIVLALLQLYRTLEHRWDHDRSRSEVMPATLATMHGERKVVQSKSFGRNPSPLSDAQPS